VTLHTISNLLTGYARVQIYQCFNIENEVKKTFNTKSTPKLNFQTKVMEGQFSKGRLDGYGREWLSDYTAKVGYFNQNYISGKGMQFDNGKLVSQGIFAIQEGVEQLIKEKEIENFLSNVD
jgi:hypothetical protein